ATTTVSGTLTITGYTTLAFSTTAQTLALTGTGTGTLSNNETIDMSTGSNAAHVLQVAGSSISFGTLITGTGSKVEYTSTTGGQTIRSLTYNNLQLDNTSGTNTAGGNLTLNGTLTTTAGGVLNMGTNLLSVTAASNSGTIRTQNTTSLPISTGETWGGTVQYDASSGQTVVAGTYNNLNTSNSAGVSLGGGVTVSGTLTLTSGNLTTGAYTLTLGSTATLSEAAGHYVVGNLQTTQAVGSGASSNFGGIGVTLGAALEDLGNVTVTRISGSHVTLNSNTGINRIWKINPINALTVARDLTISWIADDDNSKVLISVQAWKSTDDFASVDNTSTIGSTTDASSSRSVTASLPSLTGAATTSFTVSQSNQPLPVELTSFNSSVNGKAVNLNWKTATEINNYGFEVERIRNEELGIKNWEKVGFVTGAGNSNSPKEYSFTDKSVTSGKYLYRLKQLDNDGQYSYSKEVEADLGTPTAFVLEQNYPNPFNPSTVIRYTLPFESNVKLIVYNLIGEVVKELVSETVSAGYQEVSFDAGKLSSGIYFYTLHATSLDGKQNYQSVKKMLLLK
ncbi:MAG: T9SS type A sorting domain-containing protein, partial [Ignavibacteria bacterium]|nr:T9SS type A sorting domain-containing protein [Ignavibacteria bacterium]